MNKTLLGFALSFITMSLSAQQLNRKYDLYYLDKRNYAYYTGAFMRNDTIFITLGAIVNVISIQSEDSIWKSILLRPYREHVPGYIKYSGSSPSTTPFKPLKKQ